MEQLNLKPRVGGANLECFMLARMPLPFVLSALLIELIDADRKNSSQLSLRIEDFKFEDVLDLSGDNLWNIFDRQSWQSMDFQVAKEFNDVELILNIRAYRNLSTVVISTLEDMIWAFDDKTQNLKFTRLEEFVRICWSVVEKFQASLVLIGSEPCTASEFHDYCNQTNPFPASKPEIGLSNKNVKDLYNWYTSNYTERWRAN